MDEKLLRENTRDKGDSCSNDSVWQGGQKTKGGFLGVFFVLNQFDRILAQTGFC